MRQRSPLLHLAFYAAIAIKGLDGLIETVAGLLIAAFGTGAVYRFAVWLTAPELSDHPVSHVAHLVRHGAAKLATVHTGFIVTYLLIHGIIKSALAINLIIGHKWIFPVASVVLVGFVGYLSYRCAIHWSGWVLALALFDFFTLVLVLNEWRVRGQH
ncbi:MAG TPA: DUF2127 domain-containing protein [Rhizomicrobium sp.]